MGIKNLLNGEELITKQNSILKDLPSKGLKEFSPNNSWIEKKQIEKKLEEKFNFINTERIEKSNNLSVAEWVPYLGKAKVLKKTGKLWETIGHHKDNEDWLLPEEILFLVENCELQLILDNVSASIEDCYTLLLQEELCSFDEYRVYSHLCRAGLRVIRHSPSVTVTSYEQQVHLDTIVQQCKRSPPSTLSINPDDNEVMIIDEVYILKDPPNKETDTASVIKNQNIGNSEVIEIEDDIDPNPIIEELLDSSSDSSDVICISSPSYASETCRLWYPTVNQCLIRSMEKVIDLCSDDSPNDYKKIIHNKLDLIKYSKAEVLSLLPSAINGVTVIHSPDSRLLPSNVVPKYSEYKVNLNIRSDYRANNNFKHYYNPISRMPFINMSNNSQMNAELMANPLFQKAEEMQAMALNMIQTASTLMSVLSSQNPNELWNFIDGRGQEIRFQPRFRDFQQQRPYCRFPRRNYRAIRRRIPYEKRGGARYFRRYNEFNNSYGSDLHSSKDFSPEVKVETVVLSDDDDSSYKKDSFLGEFTNSKRKRMDSDITFKKIKTESDHVESSLVLEDSGFNIKKNDTDILTESDNNENAIEIVNNQDNIKQESHNLIDCIEIDEVLNGTQVVIDETDISNKSSTSETKGEKKRNLETEIILKKNELHKLINTNDILKNIEYSEKKIRQVASFEMQNLHQITNVATGNIQGNEQYVQQISRNSVGAVDITNIDLCKNYELKTVSDTEDICTLNDKITSWEEYKNTDDCKLGDKDGSLEESESILQLENCRSYGDILKSLQIFKEINLAKKRKKIKIAYDVYLPGASFKKTLKVLPNFRVIILKSCEELPTPMDLKSLKTDYQDQIPLLFTIVFNETVGFYLYDTISVPSFLEKPTR